MIIITSPSFYRHGITTGPWLPLAIKTLGEQQSLAPDGTGQAASHEHAQERRWWECRAAKAPAVLHIFIIILMQLPNTYQLRPSWWVAGMGCATRCQGSH